MEFHRPAEYPYGELKSDVWFLITSSQSDLSAFNSETSLIFGCLHDYARSWQDFNVFIIAQILHRLVTSLYMRTSIYMLVHLTSNPHTIWLPHQLPKWGLMIFDLPWTILSSQHQIFLVSFVTFNYIHGLHLVKSMLFLTNDMSASDSKLVETNWALQEVQDLAVKLLKPCPFFPFLPCSSTQ